MLSPHQVIPTDLVKFGGIWKCGWEGCDEVACGGARTKRGTALFCANRECMKWALDRSVLDVTVTQLVEMKYEEAVSQFPDFISDQIRLRPGLDESAAKIFGKGYPLLVHAVLDAYDPDQKIPIVVLDKESFGSPECTYCLCKNPAIGFIDSKKKFYFCGKLGCMEWALKNRSTIRKLILSEYATEKK